MIHKTSTALLSTVIYYSSWVLRSHPTPLSLCYCVFNLHFTRATAHFQLSVPWAGSFGWLRPRIRWVMKEGDWAGKKSSLRRTTRVGEWGGNTGSVWCRGFSWSWSWNSRNHSQMLESRTLFTSPQRNVSGFNAAHVYCNKYYPPGNVQHHVFNISYEWLRSHLKKEILLEL